MNWQYWLWFTFIFLINLYFVFLYRTLDYRRLDIRGRRSSGDKRRGAWPEIFTCFLPFLWCINILHLSLYILKTIETNGSYVILNVHIIGFQWGWKYGYDESGYQRLLTNPVIIGRGSIVRPGKTHNVNLGISYLRERAYIRSRLINSGKISYRDGSRIGVQVYQPSLWVVAQGMNSQATVIKYYLGGLAERVVDPLRLLRASGCFVLPTRMLIRLLASAEDVIHSWAVPGLGLKLDCVPGRLFVSFLNITREGAYYGQCSELCGWNHYNMPIVLYALPLEHFIGWWEFELFASVMEVNPKTGKRYDLLSVKYK